MPTDYTSRYHQLQKIMGEQYIEHFLIKDPIDINYFTGIACTQASLLAHRDTEPDFIVDDRYFHGIATNYWCLRQRKTWRIEGNVAFDSERMSYARFQHLSTHAHLLPCKGVIQSVQQIKDCDELQAMQQAADEASHMFHRLTTYVQEGMSEWEVAQWIALNLVQKGAHVAFEPIVAFAEHTAIAHHVPGNRRLKKGDMVTIDLGAIVSGYCSDMTRSFFFKEIMNKQLEELWHLVHEAYHIAYDTIRTGVTSGLADEKVRQFFARHALEPNFTHSLGHGIGLRVHEDPRIHKSSLTELKENMVITIEPGLYIPGLGGVRLENTIAIRKNSCYALTQADFMKVI